MPACVCVCVCVINTLHLGIESPCQNASMFESLSDGAKVFIEIIDIWGKIK